MKLGKSVLIFFLILKRQEYYTILFDDPGSFMININKDCVIKHAKSPGLAFHCNIWGSILRPKMQNFVESFAKILQNDAISYKNTEILQLQLNTSPANHSKDIIWINFKN